MGICWVPSLWGRFKFEVDIYIALSIIEIYNKSHVHSVTGVYVIWSVCKPPLHWPNHQQQLGVLYLAQGHFYTQAGGDGIEPAISRRLIQPAIPLLPNLNN